MSGVVCYEAWLKNRHINPKTGRRILPNRRIYRKLEGACILAKQLPELDRHYQPRQKIHYTCRDEWLHNRKINPVTGRTIKKDKPVFRAYERACAEAGRIPIPAWLLKIERRRSQQENKVLKKVHEEEQNWYNARNMALKVEAARQLLKRKPIEQQFQREMNIEREFEKHYSAIDQQHAAKQHRKQLGRDARQRFQEYMKAAKKGRQENPHEQKSAPYKKSPSSSSSKPSSLRIRKQFYNGSPSKYQAVLKAVKHWEAQHKKNNHHKYHPMRFENVQLLGQGAFGTVSLVRDRAKTKDNLLVLKRFNKFEPKKNQESTVALSLGEVATELTVLRKLQNICGKYAVCYDGFFEDPHYYFLTTKYLGDEMTTFAKFMEMKSNRLTSKQKVAITNELVKGLKAIHHAGVAHRDIKPDNILISLKTHQPRYIDFGISCWEEQCKEDFTTGTPWWSAPELIGSERKIGRPAPEFSLENYQKSDIYALGLLILEFIVGRNPIVWDWCVYKRQTTIDSEGRTTINNKAIKAFYANFDINHEHLNSFERNMRKHAQELHVNGGPNLFSMLDINPARRRM